MADNPDTGEAQIHLIRSLIRADHAFQEPELYRDVYATACREYAKSSGEAKHRWFNAMGAIQALARVRWGDEFNIGRAAR